MRLRQEQESGQIQITGNKYYKTLNMANDSSNPGIQTAIVVDNKDPDQRGRIKVSFPYDSENTATSWARVVQVYAGDQYGSYFLPEVGDEVLVGFEMNNHSNPIVLGCLYNGQKKQPASYDADNYIKNIKTKAGNEINFSDKPGEETVLVVNKTADDNQILLTLKDDGKITIQSKGKIEITAPEINMNANKKFNIAGGEVSISGSKITLDSTGDVVISSKGKISETAIENIEMSTTIGDVKLSGMNVEASAQVGATVKGMVSAELSASAETTVKGAIVMIN